MGFLQFVFSSFWVWLGFFVLELLVMGGISQIIGFLPKRGRSITIHKIENEWFFTIDNANDMDVLTVLREVERQDQNRLWTVKKMTGVTGNEPGTFEQ